MKIRVTPVAITQIGFDLLLKDSYDLTGQNFSKEADKQGLKNYSKYFSILKGMKENNKLIEKEVIFLKHLFFSFLIFASSGIILELCELSDLSITTCKAKNGRLALFSGTLEQWKNLLNTNLNETIKRELVSLFHQLGLGKVI